MLFKVSTLKFFMKNWKFYESSHLDMFLLCSENIYLFFKTVFFKCLQSVSSKDGFQIISGNFNYSSDWGGREAVVAI